MARKNDTEMYSMNNEGKSVVAERFIRTLNNKTYKYMTSKSKSVQIDKSVDTINKYISTCHRTIKTKPVDIKLNNDKGPEFKIGDIVRISKYKKIFAKD